MDDMEAREILNSFDKEERAMHDRLTAKFKEDQAERKPMLDATQQMEVLSKLTQEFKEDILVRTMDFVNSQQCIPLAACVAAGVLDAMLDSSTKAFEEDNADYILELVNSLCDHVIATR